MVDAMDAKPLRLAAATFVSLSLISAGCLAAVYDIRAFDAEPGGRTHCTDAIQKAVQVSVFWAFFQNLLQQLGHGRPPVDKSSHQFARFRQAQRR
jgi:hypothetical protein